MKSSPFRYTRAESPEAAVSALVDLGDEAKVIAGGQSLLPMMSLRLARPGVLIDVGGCGLSGVSQNGSIEIGATTTQNEARAAHAVQTGAPLLEHALGYVGHHALRNRGTVGGSIAHADPAAEIPAVLLALGGEVVVLGPGGSRTIHVDDLFVSTFTTALSEDELLTAVRLPEAAADAWGFAEVARRQGDFAIAGVAAAMQLDSNLQVTEARLALFGVDQRPVRVPEAESALSGQRLDDPGVVAAAAAAARAGVEPVGDLHGSTVYRKRMTEVVVRRAIENATIKEAKT